MAVFLISMMTCPGLWRISCCGEPQVFPWCREESGREEGSANSEPLARPALEELEDEVGVETP